MHNIIVLVAGPESEKRNTLARKVKARYKDMIVLPADNPENVFQRRIKYDGNASIYTVLIADKEDLKDAVIARCQKAQGARIVEIRLLVMAQRNYGDILEYM